MKNDLKHLLQFLFRSSFTTTACLLTLACLETRHLQAASLSLDQNFNAPFFAAPVFASRAVLMPGGKYVMFANLDTLEDQSTGSIMRFNSDGSLDTTFSFSHDCDGVFAVAS